MSEQSSAVWFSTGNLRSKQPLMTQVALKEKVHRWHLSSVVRQPPRQRLWSSKHSISQSEDLPKVPIGQHWSHLAFKISSALVWCSLCLLPGGHPPHHIQRFLSMYYVWGTIPARCMHDSSYFNLTATRRTRYFNITILQLTKLRPSV